MDGTLKFSAGYFNIFQRKRTVEDWPYCVTVYGCIPMSKFTWAHETIISIFLFLKIRVQIHKYQGRCHLGWLMGANTPIDVEIDPIAPTSDVDNSA